MIELEKFLDKYYSENEPIILGCSSGPDSMFLLYKILDTRYKDNLVVCYFNHKTRPETDIEENFIKKLGEKEGFRVEIAECDFEKIKKLNPGKGFEELAREKRYAFFNSIINIYKSKYVITAHHLDDKIETFFFNLVRGTKLTGLINMTESSGGILRPLLNLKKGEILEYLDKNKLEYKTDITNNDIDFTRNYLRHEIIPKLKKINKNYKNNICNTLNYFEELKNNIDEDIKKFLNSPESSIDSSTTRAFNIKSFNLLQEFMQKEVIRYIYYISNGNSTIGLNKDNIKEIIKFINGKGNKTIKEIKKLKMKKDNKIIIY